MENTYAWIIDTAISREYSKIWEKIIILNIIMLLIDWPEDPKRDSNRWPAIILAVKRIAKVNGRITRLIVSIIVINGISIIGVPWGVRWVNKSLI